MFAKGRKDNLMEIFGRMSQKDILSRYFNITRLPVIIKSPLREDKHPSMCIYEHNGKVMYKDFSRGDCGDVVNLLQRLWNCSFVDTINKIAEDFPTRYHVKSSSIIHYSKKNTNIEVKVRKWEKHDIEYWESYGISVQWLNYAEVYPISHKIITTGNNRYVMGADKYAYVYVEHKEGITQLKIYQPFNKEGFKWMSKFDGSVISLWTKIPEQGKDLILCSSVKDALCVWANTGIPCLSPQGEGYGISNTAIYALKARYDNIYVLYDNDEAGIYNAKKLSERTGFKYIELPKEYGEKDCSDLYKKLNNKEEFKKIIINLINS